MADVLIIDDDLHIREIYKEAVQQAGHHPVVAINGKQGLKLIQEGGFDLIFLDVMIPIIDGIEILQQLKKSPPIKPNGPIYLITSLSQNVIIDRAKHYGVTKILDKSTTTPGKLIQIITEFFKENNR